MPQNRFYPQIICIPPEVEDTPRIFNTRKLEAWWRFEDVNDSWYNALNFTNVNSVEFKRGRFGKCARGNGTSSYLNRASHAKLNPLSDDFQFGIILRGIAAGSGTRTILDKFSGGTGYKLEVDSSTGILTFTIGTAVGSASVSSTSGILDGKWHYVLLTVLRSTSISMMIDSVERKNTTMLDLVGDITNGAAFRLFANQTPAQFWDGEIDLLFYFRGRVLDIEESKTFFDLNSRYVVTGIDERGMNLVLDSIENSTQMSFNVAGSDIRSRRRYQEGSQAVLLYDSVSLDGLRGAWNFMNTLDDESLNGNELVRQAGSDSFVSGGGINFDGTVWYSVENTETIYFANRICIAGRLVLRSFTGTARLVLDIGGNIRIFANPNDNTAVFRVNIGGTNRERTFVFTPGTPFNFVFWYDGTAVRLKINDSATSSLSVTGNISNSTGTMTFGANTSGGQRLQTGDSIIRLKIWERTFTEDEVQQLASRDWITRNCIFDGIILGQPTRVAGAKPFRVVCRDYLSDRINGETVTIQFAGSWMLGTMLRTVVARTSLAADFDTSNIADGTHQVEGKYFVREPCSTVFDYVARSAGTVIFSRRRGFKRYLFSEIPSNVYSSITVNPNNIILPYQFESEIYQQVNTVEIEGGKTKTLEQQQTFDNGTTKSSTIYYALKITPGFLIYGHLEVKMRRQGTLFDDLYVEIREDASGSPGPALPKLSQIRIPKEAIDGTMTFRQADFDVVLDRTKTYWIVFFPSGDASNNIVFADNGGASDTNMKTSSNGTSWTAVGYTFVYKWNRTARIVAIAKHSNLSTKYKPRKVKISDESLTDRRTAKILAMGILNKMAKIHRHLDGIRMKGLTAIPVPKEMVFVSEPSAGISDWYPVQQVVIEMPPGKGGFFDHYVLSLGDKKISPEQLFQQMYAAFRTTLAADEPPISDVNSFAESLGIGIRAEGRRLAGIQYLQRIGVSITYDSAGFKTLNQSDMIWDGNAENNVYEIGVYDA